MSDDRQEPPAGEQDDRTRPLPPAADRAEPPRPTRPTSEPDETAPIDRAGPGRPAGSPDQTMPIDSSAATPPGSPATPPAPTAPATPPAPTPAATPPAPTPPAPTRAATPPAPTAPADQTTRLPAERSVAPSWSGRAEVRPPRPDEAGEWYVEEQGARRWWLPILWGVLALLLAGLLGGALWLVLAKQDDDRDDPDSTPSVPPASATSAAPTSASPTSAAPTSEAPSSPPPSSAPVEVPVPPLAGLPQATAEGLLSRLGLAYEVVYRPSELPPGTVVGTEPGSGTPVSSEDEVLLIISQARPSTGVSPTAPSPTVTGTP
ncbi:PASTA domain-containing protein [Micromonospora sp. DT228]|uniref:PASTA domain-containing protein n=1 Tax=Micromonospora sp. DT228 TaxID=3393443 RepID=UPI003CF7549D